MLIILGFKLARHLKFASKTMVCIAIILLTVIITIVLYPQAINNGWIEKLPEANDRKELPNN